MLFFSEYEESELLTLRHIVITSFPSSLGRSSLIRQKKCIFWTEDQIDSERAFQHNKGYPKNIFGSRKTTTKRSGSYNYSETLVSPP